MIRILIAASLCFTLLSGESLGQDKGPASGPADKHSYSVGYQIGTGFRTHKIPIDPALLAKGVSDAMGGQKPMLSQQEMQAVLTELQTKMGESNRLLMEESARKNLATGEKFLAENRTKEGVKTLPSGLQYKVLKAGTGPAPKASDKVTVQYRGTLLDGTEFDSTYSRNAPVTFPLDRTIPGWREALQLMKAGSKCSCLSRRPWPTVTRAPAPRSGPIPP